LGKALGLQQKIKDDMVAAMKAKDSLRLSTIRMIRSALKNTEIDKGSELTDKDIFSVLQKMVKQRHDSISQFEKADRRELVEKEKTELEIIQAYLPPALSEDEILRVIEETAKEVGAQGMQDMGKVMKAVGAKFQGRADGKLVSDLVKKKLSSS
jgi:hypothetical protein